MNRRLGLSRFLRACISVVLLTNLLGVAMASIPDNLYAPSRLLPRTHHHLVTAVQDDTEAGALKWFSCLSATNPTFHFSVLHFAPTQVGASHLVPSPTPWVVAVGSYATAKEAQETLTVARAQLRYDGPACKSLYTGTPPSAAYAVQILRPNPVSGQQGAKPPVDIPIVLARTPLARFDGIGSGSFKAEGDTSMAVLHFHPATSADEALTLLSHYQALHPDVHFATVRLGRAYYLAIAALTNKAAIDEAMQVVRRRGLYDFGLVQKIPVGTTSFITEDPLQVATLRPHPAVPPLRFDPAPSPTVALQEKDELIEPTTARVKRCYQEIIAINVKAGLAVTTPTAEQLASCSGVVLTGAGLTRCLLDSDCKGPRIPIGFLIDPPAAAKACLVKTLALDRLTTIGGGLCAGKPDKLPDNAPAGTETQGQCIARHQSEAASSCLGTTLDRGYVQFLNAIDPTGCLTNAAGTCPDPASLVRTYCSANPTVSTCSASARLDELVSRTRQINDCLRDGRCDGVVPRLGYTKLHFQFDLARAAQAADAGVEFAKEGVAFINKTQELAGKIQECLKKRDAREPSANACMQLLGLNDEEKKIYECLASKPNVPTAVADCATMSPDVQAALTRAKCIADAGTDLNRLKACGISSDAVNQAKNAVDCAAKQANPADVLLKCAGTLPPDIATVIQCIPKPGSLSQAAIEAVTKCLPSGYGDTVASARCLATATTPQEQMKCVPAFLGGIDPRVQKTLACATSATNSPSPTAALAVCIPGDSNIANTLACLNREKTDLGRASCVAGSLGVDPKTLETVACLANSNGEPLAMANCAVGNVLPPEAAKALSCAANSTGATDFALCAAGSGLNPEWRITAECAASSGGEPITFAGCTAGRLTLRELGKCLSGQIGTDGGCFGPSNEFVKAFNTVANDLQYGLGENNEVRKALGAITEPLKAGIAHLGGEVSRGLQDLGRGIEDLGRRIFNW